MSKYARLGKNTGLIFIGSAGSKLMSLLMLPFYTRWLTTADYGSVDLITTYSGLMLGIVSCSIFDSVFLFPKDQPLEKQKKYFSSALIFWLVTLLFISLVCWLVRTWGNNERWTGFIFDYLWYIFAVLASSYLQTIVQQFLRAIDKMVIYSNMGVVLTVATISLSFLLIPSQGVKGYINSIVIGNLISIIFAFTIAKLWRYVSIYSANKSTLREMLIYSVPLIPNGIMWFLINSLNRPLLESWTGIAAVGIFAVAGKFPNLLNTVYLLFQNAWIISVVEEAPKDTYQAFYNRMLKLVVIGQSLLAVLLAFAGKWIIQLFTTPEYYSAWQYIPLLVVGVIFMNIATFVGSNFAVTRESKYYFYSTLWAGGVSVALNFALIPIFGLWGACWSIILSQAVCMFSRIKYSWRTVKITNVWFYLPNALLLSLCMAASLLIHSIAGIIISFVIFIAFFYLVNRRSITTLINRIVFYYEKRFSH